VYTIGQLVKKFNLSRSTLLYYDSIGLLWASARTGANYRRYSDQDLKRLEQICVYRRAGIPLEDIKKILNSTADNTTTSILEKRFFQLNEEIQRLRQQQHFIAGILKNGQLLERKKVISKDVWIALLHKMGLDNMAARRWHMEFERSFPEEHQLFLESLGLSPEEISKIRGWSIKVSKDRSE